MDTDRTAGSATRRRVAVPYDIACSSPMEVVAAIGDVCEIVWVVDRSDPRLATMGRLLPRLGTVIDTDALTSAQLLDQLSREHVNGVIAFNDSQLPIAAAIGGALALECNCPEVVDRLNDKYLQRVALAQAGIAVPEFRQIRGTTDVAAAIALTHGMTFPVVIKPCRGDGSRDVLAADDLAELERAFQLLLADDHATEDFIVEEFLQDRSCEGHRMFGGYVSVEMIVQRGRPVPLAITGRFAPVAPFRETGNFMPHLLDEDDAAAVVALAVDAANALEVRCGALHTEIKLTPDGPRLIEVNGRVGGGGIDAMYARMHGRSLTQLATLIAVGEHVDLEPVDTRSYAGPFAYEFFVQPPTWAHRLCSIGEPERLIGTAGAHRVAVNRSPSDDLDWRHGSQGYIVRVSGESPDRAALAAVPQTITESIAIEYS